MSAVIPLWREVWFRARREKQYIVETVLMADDTVRKVQFGPRGGWKYLD